MSIGAIVGRIFLIVIGGVFLVGFYYMIQINTLTSTGLLTLSETIKKPEVGMTLKEIRLVEKEDGKTVVDLTATEATIDKSSDVIRANGIMVRTTGDKQEPVVVFADTGIVDRKKGELFLSGDTLVRLENGTILNTETLFWDMKQERFSTDDFVVIRADNLLLTGVGMVFTGDSQDIVLNDNVSAFIY